MDVLLTLQYLLPAPKFGGCIEYETPIKDSSGINTGEFYNYSIEEIKQQYENLRWEDYRTKPTWEELEAIWPEAEKKSNVPKIHANLGRKFEEAIVTVSVELRAYFTQLQVLVNTSLNKEIPDLELAKFYIETAVMPGDTYTEGYELPEPFETIKQSLLEEFNV